MTSSLSLNRNGVVAVLSIAALSACTWPIGAMAQCTTQPVPTTVVESVVNSGTPGVFPSISMDSCSRFAIAWQEALPGTTQTNVRYLRFDADGSPITYSGDGTAGSVLSMQGDCNILENANNDTVSNGISVALNDGGTQGTSAGINFVWTIAYVDQHGHTNPEWVRSRVWSFDAAVPPDPLGPPPAPTCSGPGDQPWNSAGVIYDESSPAPTYAWTSYQNQLKLKVPNNFYTPELCDPVCFTDRWAPCIATRSDGNTVAVWCRARIPAFAQSPMDVRLAQFDASGDPVGPAGVGGIQVNTALGAFDTYESPAVAFQGNDIVVVYTGPDRTLCNGGGPRRIYARRLTWGGPTQNAQLVGDEFVVDSNREFKLGPTVRANPTVALTTAEPPLGTPGAFVVAWNAMDPQGTPGTAADDTVEVHAQYFDADGQPIRGEFKVNTGEGQLAPSGTHTLTYGPASQVVAVWTDGTTDPEGARFTLLPSGHAATVPGPCIEGDVNGDGLVNGADIQPFCDFFIDDLIRSPLTESDRARILCATDIDHDIALDGDDVALFVWLLLGYPTADSDCDGNCRPDWIDIALGATDCNHDFIPDSCQVYCCTPPEECPSCESRGCLDCNDNGIVDSCEGPPTPRIVDCNNNGLDDADDIAQARSEDCNDSGVPDECELANYDCNENGYPDDCDIAEARSEDCNGNGFPDECELALGTAYDCQPNGIPDECDIAEATSEDENANNVPDECEGDSLQGGGEGQQQSEESESPPADPESTYWQWAAEQTWDGMTVRQIMHALRAKRLELGLPAW